MRPAVAWPVSSGVFTILKGVCWLCKDGQSVIFRVVKVVLLKIRRRRGVLMEGSWIDGSFNESILSCNSYTRCYFIETVSSRYVIRWSNLVFVDMDWVTCTFNLEIESSIALWVSNPLVTWTFRSIFSCWSSAFRSVTWCNSLFKASLLSNNSLICLSWSSVLSRNLVINWSVLPDWSNLVCRDRLVCSREVLCEVVLSNCCFHCVTSKLYRSVFLSNDCCASLKSLVRSWNIWSFRFALVSASSKRLTRILVVVILYVRSKSFCFLVIQRLTDSCRW